MAHDPIDANHKSEAVPEDALADDNLDDVAGGRVFGYYSPGTPEDVHKHGVPPDAPNDRGI